MVLSGVLRVDNLQILFDPCFGCIFDRCADRTFTQLGFKYACAYR